MCSHQADLGIPLQDQPVYQTELLLSVFAEFWQGKHSSPNKPSLRGAPPPHDQPLNVRILEFLDEHRGGGQATLKAHLIGIRLSQRQLGPTHQGNRWSGPRISRHHHLAATEQVFPFDECIGASRFMLPISDQLTHEQTVLPGNHGM